MASATVSVHQAPMKRAFNASPATPDAKRAIRPTLNSAHHAISLPSSRSWMAQPAPKTVSSVSLAIKRPVSVNRARNPARLAQAVPLAACRVTPIQKTGSSAAPSALLNVLITV